MADKKQAKATIDSVNDAVEEQMESTQDKKQKEKQAKKEKQYWNSMITRKEAVGMVREGINNALQAERERSRIMFIQLKTLTQHLINEGITTEEQLDELSKPIVKEVYGLSDEELEEAIEESEKENEGTQE